MVRSVIVGSVAQHKNPVPNAAIHRGMLCTSAILGKDIQTDSYPPDTDTQARLCFQYLRDILTAAGASLQDVLSIDLYFRDKSDRTIVNKYWLECWPDPLHRPARNAHVSELPDGCNLQVTAMAIIDEPTGSGR